VTELERLVVRPDAREPLEQFAEVRLEARWRQHDEANRNFAAGVPERVRATLRDEPAGPGGCKDRSPSSSNQYDLASRKSPRRCGGGCEWAGSECPAY
jgi:hypothetical protein